MAREIPQKDIENMMDAVADVLAGVEMNENIPIDIKNSMIRKLWNLFNEVKCHNVYNEKQLLSLLDAVWLRGQENECRTKPVKTPTSISRCRPYLGLMMQFGSEYEEWMQCRPAIVAEITRKKLVFNWHDYRIRKQHYSREHTKEMMTHQEFLEAIHTQKIWVLTDYDFEQTRRAYIQSEIEYEQNSHRKEMEELLLKLEDPHMKW